MTFEILVIAAVTIWLASLGACILAFQWSRAGTPKRSVAAILLSAAALVIAYLGLTRFRLSGSETVNEKVVWRLESKWFFTITLILAAATLAYTLWKLKSSRATTQLRNHE